ncbi:MAG: TlyA family RNA methyltransferase [Anaerotruncus sp.]|nr:TlyA family RNA methyltransferase [Anaerotruncus sp.]
MKKRLDVLLVEQGFFPSREKAKAVIMAGQVYVNQQKSDKPGMEVDSQALLEVRGDTLKYVSRGGLKLEKAMQQFPIRLEGKICMDIGASTGGFTDCMLQNGAAHVYAVDVGYGQLAWNLRNDERVTNLERTNIRYITKEQISEPLDFVSVDVSFISLKLVLPVAALLLTAQGEAVCLVKPQFEAGREKVGKKGVVRERSTHVEVLQKAVGYARENGFAVCGLDFSPVKGPEGNIEYLMYLKKDGVDMLPEETIAALVNQSHADLD